MSVPLRAARPPEAAGLKRARLKTARVPGTAGFSHNEPIQAREA